MTLRQKIFDRKTWYAPQRAPLCDPKNFSTTVFLWNTEVFPYEVFRYFETTNSQMKSWFSPLKHKFFRYQNFSKTQKASSANFFQNCETTNFWQKIAILPSPFLSIKTFDTRIFLKHRRVPLPSFFVLWDNKFSIEDRVIPLWGKKFDNRIFLKHRRLLLRSFSTLRQKNFDRETWYVRPSKPSPLLPKKFSTPKVLWNTEVFPYNVFRYGETTSFRLKIVIFSLRHKFCR